MDAEATDVGFISDLQEDLVAVERCGRLTATHGGDPHHRPEPIRVVAGADLTGTPAPLALRMAEQP